MAVQFRRDRTGLPDGLKAGMEAQSGLSLDRVRVRYNSAQPARFGAAATTRGTAIDVAPGQERHIPHELGHVVQQLQGRVRATARLHGVPLNDDPALEVEADRLGAQALRHGDAGPLYRPAPRPGRALADQPPRPSASPPGLSPTAPLQLARPKGKTKIGKTPAIVSSIAKKGARKLQAAAAAASRRIIPGRAAKTPDFDYGPLLGASGGGFSLSRDPDLIYPQNPAELISTNAVVNQKLWAGRNRGTMGDAHTIAILEAADIARTTGANAYTKQEDKALGPSNGPDVGQIVKALGLSKIKSSRNHKLADSSVYSILAHMVATAGVWSKTQKDAVAELVRALHGNDAELPAIQQRMLNAFKAANEADKAKELSVATFLASHGVNNLRLGDADDNTRVLNAYDPNFTNVAEYESDTGKVLTQTEVDKLLQQWGKGTPVAAQRKKPRFRRRGTLRSEEIRAVVLKLAKKRVISQTLADAAVTGVYDRQKGHQVSSSFAK
jgi:hypothetical protein